MIAPIVQDIPDGAVLVDVRWYLDGRDGRAAYEAAHLPDAIWVDLEADLAAHDQPATEGRHPLPTPEAFAAAMSKLGIDHDSIVVAYDDTGGMTAARLVLMLRWLGIDAALLDGGLTAWVADGRPTESGPGRKIRRAAFAARPWPIQRRIDADGVADRGAVPLLDARAPERFTGESPLAGERPGHIPGARNAPWAAVLQADGRVRSKDELTAHYRDLGVREGDPVICSCGSGVSACLNVLALEHAGFGPATLYVGSWSGWSADEDRPADTGQADPE